ncbi:MAG TPA: hypothetical protein ENL01_01520 [Chlorobaculum parvum]|uniref:Uncharacterized protein n=1 Tax=Chlorobaculum parvum TaxID=274539 RepID=A0A7C5H9T1_9CHLB|nr:hypothetical protein [Chlorobaculum parvum]
MLKGLSEPASTCCSIFGCAALTAGCTIQPFQPLFGDGVEQVPELLPSCVFPSFVPLGALLDDYPRLFGELSRELFDVL